MNIPGAMRWFLSRFPSDKIWLGDRFQSCILVISRQRLLHRATDRPRECLAEEKSAAQLVGAKSLDGSDDANNPGAKGPTHVVAMRIVPPARSACPCIPGAASDSALLRKSAGGRGLSRIQ